MFLGILTWLRTHKVWHTPGPTDTKKIQLRRLRCEADFSDVNGLIQAIDAALSVCVEQRISTIEFQNEDESFEKLSTIQTELAQGMVQFPMLALKRAKEVYIANRLRSRRRLW